MSNPKTGSVTREWVVESFVGLAYKKGGIAVSSARKGLVSEAYLMSSSGTLIALSATIIAHDRSVPDQGTVGGTQAATLGPQQFIVGLYGVGGSEIGTIGGGTVNGTVNAVFYIRGR